MSRQKPKPDFIHLVDGGRSRKAGRGRGGGKRERKAAPTPPPDHLTDQAKRCWLMFEPVLRKMGVFQPPDDVIALERTCELYADIVDLQKEISTQGRFYKTTNKAGDVMIRPHPAAGQLADADRRFQSYLAEFGLTPSARAKLLRTGKPDNASHQTRDAAEAFF